MYTGLVKHHSLFRVQPKDFDEQSLEDIGHNGLQPDGGSMVRIQRHPFA